MAGLHRSDRPAVYSYEEKVTRAMVTRIFYDSEFYDDGISIAPLSIAMQRLTDGERLYCVSDDLVTMARAAENAWMRDNVLRWLPITIEFRSAYGALNAHVQWDETHSDYDKLVSLDEMAERVEDFVLAKSDPELWAYYAAYDHVLYAQLFGPMIELPSGMPMYTMDLKHECVMRGDPELPKLPRMIVDSHYGGERKEHYAPYDVAEEVWRFEWLMQRNRIARVP